MNGLLCPGPAHCVLTLVFCIVSISTRDVQAQDFKKQGTKIKRKMWVENMKIKLVVFGIVALLALLVALSVCPRFKC